MQRVAIGIDQIEGRVRQPSSYRQRRPNGPDDTVGKRIRARMPAVLLQGVNFHQSHARGVVFSAHDRGVIARRQRDQDAAARIAWSKAFCLQLRLLRLRPVVVRGQERAGGVIKLERGILQRSRHPESGQRRSDRADDDRVIRQRIASER